MQQSRGMYEPMAVLRSLAELQHKFNPDSSTPVSFSSPPSSVPNYEEALNKAIEDGDYKSTPAFLAEENQVKVIDYKAEKVASFTIQGVEMICLPQVYELFLKTMVGGLHTVYTKLKRLEISPLVCNVEQVRALRSLGAIQPGVNRCKLIAKTDFDALYDDCTSSCNRPGRPAKRVTDDWLTAQSIACKQSKVEVGSPPLSACQPTSFSTESLLSSNPSNLLGSASSFLSGMTSLNGSQSALLGLLPGFNQILMQQVIAQAKMRENQERECENEEEEDEREEEEEEQRREEEEKEESQSSNEDSPIVMKNELKREEKNENRSRDESSSRDESKSMSPNNNSNTLTSTPSGRSSQNRMNVPDFSKLISLLESTVEQFKKRDEVNDEKTRRERAERELAVERRRSNLYITRWNRTRRELANLQQRITVLEQSNVL